MMLIDCSGCRTTLQLPQGAPCIRCAICGAVTHVATPPEPGPSRGGGTEVMMLIDCSGCRTPLQLPQGAPCIRCAICGADTHVATPREPGPSRGAGAQPAWGPPPPPAHGRKRAVVCGISYRYSPHELMGCINDANCMRHLLMTRFNFPDDSIIMLTEEQTDPYKIPTKYNIRMAMYWLVQGCQPGDSLVFHYSGHGAQQRNYSVDEADGFDETHQTLFPLDFETQGMIVDDEINTELVRPLPHGVKLHALIDACHSGTTLDLPFLCRMDRNGQYEWEDHWLRSGVWKGTSGGEAISFSGCDDDQTSADTSALSSLTGAMTYCFIQAIESGQATTYGSVLNSMRTTIRNAGDSMGRGGAVTSLLTMRLTGGSVTTGGLGQEPQLTSSDLFDVYAKPFSL